MTDMNVVSKTLFSAEKNGIKMEKKEKSQKYYANVYYIRYLIYLNGNDYYKIQERHRTQRASQGNSTPGVLLDRRQLALCCEGAKYREKTKDADESVGRLPTVRKEFADAFCDFFSVNPHEAFLDMEKTDKEQKRSINRHYWEGKRKELRNKLDAMIADQEKEKCLTGPEAETARLEEILVTVLKICDVGYLSRVSEYLTQLLRPQTRRFWMEMEKRLAGLNLYLGYQEAICAGRIETEGGWEYPATDGFAFQKNQPLDNRILESLMKRQGILGKSGRPNKTRLIEALANDEAPAISRQGLYRLLNGESRTDFMKTAAERMGEVLHASWDDMKGEGLRFWTDQAGIAVWEKAEEQMRQAVRRLRQEELAGLISGNDMEVEIHLAVKNIIRFCLCCHEPSKNRILLKELEDRIAKTPGAPAADGLICRCIRDLENEQPPRPKLRYNLLMNGMNVELRLLEAFEGELKEPLRQKAEESVMEFCQAEECTDEEKKYLMEWEIKRQKSEKQQEVFGEFQKLWLQAMDEAVCPNPWLLDEKLTITWICYEEEEAPAVLEETIEVRVQLPRELEAILEPGEITAVLPYEKGLELDDVICQNWDLICEAMDDSFGLELGGWDAELYEEWKENVGFESEKMFFRNWEPYSVENEELDRRMKKEGIGDRYDYHVAIGKMSLEGYAPELALDEEECYEEGVHLLRRASRRWKKQDAKEHQSPTEPMEKED